MPEVLGKSSNVKARCMRGRAQTGDDLSDLGLTLSAWAERGSQGISLVVAFGPVVVLELHMSLSCWPWREEGQGCDQDPWHFEGESGARIFLVVWADRV